MSKKNQKRKKEMKEQQGCPRPWRQIDDVVVDANGHIVKAPHGCSWEGDNYNDGAPAAQIIVEAVNNSRQPHPVPEWQPIETAPKDGSAILAWAEGTTTTVYWDEGLESWELCQCGAFADSGEFWPQYWMPVPAAPKPGGD